MTLSCFRKMGCSQSIRKKSKHKSEAGNTEKSYENQSFGAASRAESGKYFVLSELRQECKRHLRWTPTARKI